jgi:hypothetical protein
MPKLLLLSINMANNSCVDSLSVVMHRQSSMLNVVQSAATTATGTATPVLECPLYNEDECVTMRQQWTRSKHRHTPNIGECETEFEIL